MPKIMPQEIEVWYLLPALRGILAKVLVKEHNLTQKEVASIFGLTEAAISQYLKKKRGHEIKFSGKDLERIKKTAKSIMKDKENITKHIYNICVQLRGSKRICDMHRRYDKNLAKNCRICT